MGLPARIEMEIVLMFGFINLYMTRINLSIISVAMIKRNNSSETKPGSSQCLETTRVSNENVVLSNLNSTNDQIEELQFKEVRFFVLFFI